MKLRAFLYLCIASCIATVADVCAQSQIDSTKVKAMEPSSKKEEKNRNEMLNAESTTGPRSVNIGLPFQGDIVILENGVPVVSSFFPTSPLMAWTYDNSLGKMGLLNFSEGALLFGKVGYAVSSEDRSAGNKFKGFASMTTNNYGGQRYDVTLTGPIGKKGWGYMASVYKGFEKGAVNFMYTPWLNKTLMYKLSLQKKYSKGNVSVLYKFVDYKMAMGGYSPLLYQGNGETTGFPNFELGKDSYVIRDGMIPYYNPIDGTTGVADLNDDKFSRSKSYNFYLTGNHKFNSGWKLNYSTMWQSMNSPVPITFPLSLAIAAPNPSKYFIAGTNTPYDGYVQSVINQIYPQSKNTTWISRAEITKKVSNHDLRFGLTYWFNHRQTTTYGGMFLQTVEANPRLVDWYPAPGYKLTNNGLMPAYAGGYGSTGDDQYKRLAFYFSDDFSPVKWLDINYGGRIEHQNKREIKNPYADPHEFIGDKPLIAADFNDKWNKVGTASAVVKLTDTYGLLGDITYNTWYDSYWDYTARDANGNPMAGPGEPYPRLTIPHSMTTTVNNYGGGIYWNANKNFSIVSKVTHINKQNLKGAGAITNPLNTSERKSFDPIFYDINTLGWSTDIVASPFKNFNIHYLLTLQKPQYENYQYSAFDVTYNYSGNIIPELSQVLMEIDPSYMMMKGSLRLWFSLRYYGKQFANPTNAFFYNARMENFGGVDYTINRNIGLKLKVINFLDQKGVKGAIQGADQIVSDQNYIGKPVVASSILPRTVELSVNVKF